MNFTNPLSWRTIASCGIAAAALTACGSSGASDDSIASAIATYTEGVHASYAASAASAATMDSAIDAFVADPSDTTLETARNAWLDARNDYGPTEAFRFYDGPIDNAEDGPEGLINAWPMDESYVDYVEGAPNAGIINDLETFPTIDGELLVGLNEDGGESNISTGWHAIEFLLWGQDLDANGPGDRQASDYSTAANAERRGQYLAAASDLLLVHLDGLVDAWAPDSDNYRAEFEALDSNDALVNIITGIGELSRGELAGERMNVAYAERSQEDEHSCFSDNTTNDIIGNARGIEMVLTGAYPSNVNGIGIAELVGEVDGDLGAQLLDQVGKSVLAVEAIPAPFDQHLVADISDDSPGRQAVLNGIELLEDQTNTIVAAATALGVVINVS